MARKPVTQTSAAAPATALASKPRTTRVSTSRHSKSVAAEEATLKVEAEPKQSIEEILVSLTETPVSHEDPIDAIAKLAYGYWEERGRQGGDPLEDWVRAEEAYRKLHFAA